MAIFRGGPDEQHIMDAYNDLREWALLELQPTVQKLIRAKLKKVAREHGATEAEVARLLYRPPPGENRKSLISFLYDALFL
jgi:hypothetical protein